MQSISQSCTITAHTSQHSLGVQWCCASVMHHVIFSNLGLTNPSVFLIQPGRLQRETKTNRSVARGERIHHGWFMLTLLSLWLQGGGLRGPCAPPSCFCPLWLSHCAIISSGQSRRKLLLLCKLIAKKGFAIPMPFWVLLWNKFTKFHIFFFLFFLFL